MGVYVEYIKAMIYFTWFKQHVKQESELNDSLEFFIQIFYDNR